MADSSDQAGGATGTGFVETVPLDELEAEGRVLVNRDGHAIALFHHENEVRAVDNRCPHMGIEQTLCDFRSTSRQREPHRL